MSAHDTAGALPSGLLQGQRAVLARALSRIEQGARGAVELHDALTAHLGRAHVVGLTGAPGAGKSTLVNALLGALLARGQRIAVLAVDPSSPLTGGAVLGDRVRMGEHGADERVFIRSVASRGQLGGLARTTSALVDVFDAAGFDTVIVETVGAGQSDVDIVRVADTRVVACPPGLGDEVQAIKAGILEIADVLVVTKGDLPGAEAAAGELREMLRLRSGAACAGGWAVPVLRTAAGRGEGIGELVDALGAHAVRAGRGRRLARATTAAAAGDACTERVARLARTDPLAALLGFECRGGGDGHATVAVRLREQHLNFNGGCHGGVIFALADTAFGLASNARGVLAVGIDAHITYQRGARAGDELSATAREVSRSRRLAVYRVDITDAHGRPVSSFTGTVYLAGTKVAAA